MKKDYRYIIVEKKELYWQVWLNRPEKHNALNSLMIEELTELIKNVDESKTRLVVIRGKGKSFCAGADLSWMKNAGIKTYEENRKDAEKLARLLFSIYNLPVPVVSFVHGSVYGGALGLISASDFVFTNEKTFFSFSEVKLGLSPSVIIPYVVNKIGRTYAKGLIFTGKVFNAEEALSKKLVDKIIGENKVEDVINEYVLQIKNTAPGAIKESKRLINLLNGEINESVINMTVDSLTARRSTDEALKGINAFLSKGKISWS